jgi:hypothetical protein
MNAAEHPNRGDVAVAVVTPRAVRNPLSNSLMRWGFVEVRARIARQHPAAGADRGGAHGARGAAGTGALGRKESPAGHRRVPSHATRLRVRIRRFGKLSFSRQASSACFFATLVAAFATAAVRCPEIRFERLGRSPVIGEQGKASCPYFRSIRSYRKNMTFTPSFYARLAGHRHGFDEKDRRLARGEDKGVHELVLVKFLRRCWRSSATRSRRPRAGSSRARRSRRRRREAVVDDAPPGGPANPR